MWRRVPSFGVREKRRRILPEHNGFVEGVRKLTDSSRDLVKVMASNRSI